MVREQVSAPEVLKALGDPIRWSIVQQMAHQDELACSLLEDTLPVSKPTISYHTRILSQTGLIEVHKRGRNYFYSLRREVLRDVLAQLWELAPGSNATGDGSSPQDEELALRPAAGDDVVAPRRLLTW